ncbi:MAG: hypothetical protein M3P06_08315 [Acidobacteriota bacterium]|nr:hypothetical protein [Acidobacteriota bacterium]
MRRPLLALCLFLAATTASAFDTTKSPERIGILREATAGAAALERSLLAELRNRGFDAFDAGLTYEELLDQEAVPIAAYIVEIRGGQPHTADFGGIEMLGRHADVSLGMVVSKIAAELRLYDGATMELIASSDLSKRSSAFLPTSIGFGGSSVYASLALPFVAQAQHRRVAKKAAREAASFVTSTLRPAIEE